jgi:hypothetical protein
MQPADCCIASTAKETFWLVLSTAFCPGFTLELLTSKNRFLSLFTLTFPWICLQKECEILTLLG